MDDVIRCIESAEYQSKLFEDMKKDGYKPISISCCDHRICLLFTKK